MHYADIFQKESIGCYSISLSSESIILRKKLCFFLFSTLSSSCCLPVKIFTNLNTASFIKSSEKNDNKLRLLSFNTFLKRKQGVYSFLNRITKKQYIGSAEDLHKRMVEHLNNQK
jgi:hypothetical protein